ncbi:hypothetical protein GIB67_031048 [Kingdonia uniflora]|uniref:USP domain-containing protein n=1 Tax=Kingdonia uniflora TaxID=39325 RepID=A0A7J7NGW1_9MAGN|nr:hypothetical protein GIB67_031048 [Kingdonia uniflora]
MSISIIAALESDVASFKSKIPRGRPATNKPTLAQDIATLTDRLDKLDKLDEAFRKGDDSNTADTGNNSSSNASSKKKRGLARGSKPLPNGKKKKIGECYDISHVAWFDLKEKIRDAWKMYKYHLNITLIIGNNLGDAKASPTPEFVPREDWVKFVDYCNSEKFLAKSKMNKENQAKLIASCTLGRTSMPITRHKLESGVTDEEIGRVEVYIPAHTKKDKTIQFLDVIAELQNTMWKDPKSIRTGPNDAIAQVHVHSIYRYLENPSEELFKIKNVDYLIAYRLSKNHEVSTKLVHHSKDTYCHNCKEHRQAMKKLDLWRLPKILVVHLKRICKYVTSNAGAAESHVYKLYVISNHYGGLGGGHYSAYAKAHISYPYVDQHNIGRFG